MLLYCITNKIFGINASYLHHQITCGANYAAKGSHAVGKNRHHGSWRRRLARYSKKREQDVLADMAARDDLLSSEVQFRILEDDSWTTESYLPVFYDTVPGILNTINTSTRRPG